MHTFHPRYKATTAGSLMLATLRLACLCLVCLGLLGGCGNKGALYLEDKATPAVLPEDAGQNDEEEPPASSISAGGP